MGVFCEVCNVTVPSEVVMKDHVKGKKHLRMADIVNRQKRQAERSVFVRGFSYGTKEVTLRKLFSNYGPVDLVFVDRERGSYAIVEFRSRDAVETLLQPGHSCYLGHKKLTIKPREVKAYVPKKKPEQLPQAEEEKEPIPEVPKYDIEAVLSELPSLDDVCTQMKVLRERLKLTEEDMKQREEICQDLEAVASKIFTLCEANQFGSSVNGFGMRGCDMDIFLDLNLELKPKPADEEQSLPATELPFTKDIKAVKVVDGRITHESLKKTSWRDRIKLLGRILGGTPKFGKNVLTIPSARCPVIKVTHQATGMKCDISINNKMALRNTKFLQFLGQEERLGTLVYTAKIWAKLKDITGQGPRITSYTFTLLVIFFLQRTSPPVFPSVKELSKMTPPNESVTLEKWECSFPLQLPPTENKSTAEELLKQFFEFYSYFDFNTYMINIRDGVAEDINEFRAKALESAQLETFKFGPVCVQDPFVLDHNTTLNVNAKVKGQLVTEFQEAAAKIAHAKYKDKSIETWGIPFLLSKDKVRFFMVEEELTPENLIYSQMPYMFEISYHALTLWSVDGLKDVLDPHKRLELWVNRICDMYSKILCDALLCEEVLLPTSSGERVVKKNGAQIESSLPNVASVSSTTKDCINTHDEPMSNQTVVQTLSAAENCQQQHESIENDRAKVSKTSETTEQLAEQSAEQLTEQLDNQCDSPMRDAEENTEETAKDRTEEQGNKTFKSEDTRPSGKGTKCLRLGNDHPSTKRSLSHESAMITSESKKCRSDAEDEESDQSCHNSRDVSNDLENLQTQGACAMSAGEVGGASDKAGPPGTTTTNDVDGPLKSRPQEDGFIKNVPSESRSSDDLLKSKSVASSLGNSESNSKRAPLLITLPPEEGEHIVFHARYKTHYRMWSARKKVKSKIRVTHPDLDPILLEVKVTEELKLFENVRNEETVLSFETFVVLYKDYGKTELRIYLQPLSSSKEFTCFYSFFRSYFQKLAEKGF